MKLFDAMVYFRQQCPVGTNLDAYVIAQALAGKPAALRLLDAEDLFDDSPERELRQLQHPKYKLSVDDLLLVDGIPPGITGVVTDGVTQWTTDSTQPYAMSTMYTRSP